MPTIITGVRGTGNILANKRVIDMADKIALLEPDASPLVVLLRRLKKRVAINPKFEWMEDESMPRTDAIDYSTGYTAGATDIQVDNGSYFRVGDVVKAPGTGEQLLVTAVATNSLTVSRSWGSTGAQAFTDNDALVIIGNAYQEGATLGTIKTTQETAKLNYCQIFREPFGVTETEDASEMYGGKDLAYLRMKHGIEHEKAIERAFWFGEANEDTGGTHPRRATGGVDEFIATNVTTEAALTEAEFETFVKDVFRYGSSTKFFFAAPILVGALSTWASGKLQTFPKDKTYGISITRYLSPHGELNVINEKLFLENATFAGYGYVLDLENLAYRYLEGRDTKLITNVQANDEDSEKDEYKTEAGLEMKLEKASGRLDGVTSIS